MNRFAFESHITFSSSTARRREKKGIQKEGAWELGGHFGDGTWLYTNRGKPGGHRESMQKERKINAPGSLLRDSRVERRLCGNRSAYRRRSWCGLERFRGLNSGQLSVHISRRERERESWPDYMLCVETLITATRAGVGGQLLRERPREREATFDMAIVLDFGTLYSLIYYHRPAFWTKTWQEDGLRNFFFFLR